MIVNDRKIPIGSEIITSPKIDRLIDLAKKLELKMWIFKTNLELKFAP
jgi:hypothetical protein